MRRHGWLVLALAVAAPLAGQDLADYDYENLSFRGIGLDAGYMWPTKLGATETFGARFDLGYLGPGIRLVPSVTYWSSSFTTDEIETLKEKLSQVPLVTVEPDADLGPVTWTDVAVNVDAHFVWSTPFHVLTYLGLGAGLHTLNGSSDAFADTFVDDLLDTVTAGANAMGGLELQLTRWLRLYGEARYTVLSDVRYATARGGLAVMFGRRDPTVVGTTGGQGTGRAR